MKIKCNMCVNEVNRKCSVKKTTVKLNKSRKCNEYEFDEQREISRLERKARVMDQQEAKTKHPTTGDLSRFKTTAVQ